MKKRDGAGDGRAVASHPGSARRTADRRLVQRQNAWGTAFGLKIVQGKITGEPCYTVFVDAKKPKSKLSKADLVPATVTRGGRRLYTDVIEIQRLMFHSVPSVTDGVNMGTLSCFAQGDNGLVGISAGHALWGSDESNVQPDNIEVWLPAVRTWFATGETTRIIYESGAGTAADFGFVDAGMFEIGAPEVQDVATEAAPLNVVDELSPALRGLPVSGEGGVSGPCQGVVTHVFVSAEEGGGRRFDLMISSVDGEGMTRPGDSGLLWRTDNGAALAIHLVGENRGSLGSRFSLGCLAARVRDHLGVTALFA